MPTRSVMLLDFDNIFGGMYNLDRGAALAFANRPMEWLPQLSECFLAEDKRRWLVARCYLNPAGFVNDSDAPNGRLFFSRFRPGLVRAGFEVIDCPSMTAYGKNAADIRMVIDALDLLSDGEMFEEFVIASGDSDFAPLLQRIRAKNRIITIFAPGQVSPAYSSLSDRIIDFDAIDALVRPELSAELADETNNEDEVTVLEVFRFAPSGSDWECFVAYVTERYAQAEAPLNLSALAQAALNAVPGARERNWFGCGGFRAALEHVPLENRVLTDLHLWDSSRHTRPGDERPSGIASIVRVLDVPNLAGEIWPKVFAVLAAYLKQFEFSMPESSKWCRDELAREGTSVGRQAINYVVRSLVIGEQEAFDPARFHDPHAIAEAFCRNVLAHAHQERLEIRDDDEAEIRRWFGLDPEDRGVDTTEDCPTGEIMPAPSRFPD